jgi:hypothetical protein
MSIVTIYPNGVSFGIPVYSGTPPGSMRSADGYGSASFIYSGGQSGVWYYDNYTFDSTGIGSGAINSVLLTIQSCHHHESDRCEYNFAGRGWTYYNLGPGFETYQEYQSTSGLTWSILNSLLVGFRVIKKTDRVGISFMSVTIDYTPYPSTPTGLTATTNLSDRVNLSWNASSNTTGYYVYRDGAHIDTTSSTSYTDYGATAPIINNGTIDAYDNYSTDYIYAVMNSASRTYYNHTYQIIAYGPGGNSSATSGVTGRKMYGNLLYQFKRYDTDTWVDVGSNTTTSYVYDYTTTDSKGNSLLPYITPGSTSVSSDYSKNALSLTGTSSNAGAARAYSCYLTAAGCSAVWSGSDLGNRKDGTLTYQWQYSTDGSNYSDITGATSSTYNATSTPYAPPPTITPGTGSASDGTSVAHVAIGLSGQSVANGSTIYYRCYLTASPATAQYSTAGSGYRPAQALNYQWYRSGGDSDTSYSPLVGATSPSYNDTTAPAPTVVPGTAAASNGTSTSQVNLSLSGQSITAGEGRYYKCYISSLGATIQFSSVDRGYRHVLSPVYQWQRSSNGSTYTDISGVTGTSTADTVATGASKPTITGGSTTSSYDDYTDKVALSISGEKTNTITRYYRCHLVGDTQYATADTGYISVGSLTYQWQVSDGDSDASYSNITGATTITYNYSNAPSDARYYRCKLDATGADTNYSAVMRGRRSPGLFPMS